MDDVAGGEIAVRHLTGIGRRRIAVIAARPELRQVADRLGGARTAAAEAPLTSSPATTSSMVRPLS